MATWRDFKAFVKSGYRVVRDRPDLMQLDVRTASDRSQSVYLSHRVLRKNEDWLIIESPFAEATDVDLDKVLETAGRMVVGGVVVVGQYLVIRHAVPLANLDTNEFERPLQLVTRAADQLEREMHGEDQF